MGWTHRVARLTWPAPPEEYRTSTDGSSRHQRFDRSRSFTRKLQSPVIEFVAAGGSDKEWFMYLGEVRSDWDPWRMGSFEWSLKLTGQRKNRRSQCLQRNGRRKTRVSGPRSTKPLRFDLRIPAPRHRGQRIINTLARNDWRSEPTPRVKIRSPNRITTKADTAPPKIIDAFIVDCPTNCSPRKR